MTQTPQSQQQKVWKGQCIWANVKSVKYVNGVQHSASTESTESTLWIPSRPLCWPWGRRALESWDMLRFQLPSYLLKELSVEKSENLGLTMLIKASMSMYIQYTITIYYNQLYTYKLHMHHSVSHCGFCPNQWLLKELKKPPFEISSAQSNSLHVNCKSLPRLIRLNQRSNLNLNRCLPFLMMQETWQDCFGGKPSSTSLPLWRSMLRWWRLEARCRSISFIFVQCVSCLCHGNEATEQHWETGQRQEQHQTRSKQWRYLELLFRMLKMFAMLSMGSHESWLSSGVHFPWMMAPHSQIMPTLLDAWKIMEGCAKNSIEFCSDCSRVSKCQ